MTESPDLAGLLAIWPIAESFASQTPVGDLITLGRTTSSLRSSLHGRVPGSDRSRSQTQTQTGRKQSSPLDPEVGKHQTVHWAHLKAIAPFTCASATHTRGQTARPCVYCSRPICEACIVRDSFKHRNENTFKNRLRHFCRDCWSEGRPTKRFRFPTRSGSGGGGGGGGDGDDNDDGNDNSNEDDKNKTNNNQIHFLTTTTTTKTRTNANSDDERVRSGESEFCECNLKDNGWLCLDCKDEQNSSSLSPSRLILRPVRPGQDNTFVCSGFRCENAIPLNSPDKDRRRVCLWCQRPLRRQYAGEDRHAWNRKTIEARTRNAESRTRDLEEYNRRRMQVMRMSRREMRGGRGRERTTGDPDDEDDHDEDDRPIFVRHLDVFNYLNWMTPWGAPDPTTVWMSKNGFWRYRHGFLLTLYDRCHRVRFRRIGGVPVEEISRLTREGSSVHARLNRDLYPQLRVFGTTSPADPPPEPSSSPLSSSSPSPSSSSTSRPGQGRRRRQRQRQTQRQRPGRSDDPVLHWNLHKLKVRILDLYLDHGQSVDQIHDILADQYEVRVGVSEIQRALAKWTQDPQLWPVPGGTLAAVADDISSDDEDDDDEDDDDNSTVTPLDGQEEEAGRSIQTGNRSVLTGLAPEEPPPETNTTTTTITGDDAQERRLTLSLTPMHDHGNDDPPPYMP